MGMAKDWESEIKFTSKGFSSNVQVYSVQEHPKNTLSMQIVHCNMACCAN